MTKINNKRLFHFEQPEGCWHDWEKTTAKDSLILIYKCKICGTLQGPLSDQSDFIPNPSYSTSPADRERLLECLMGKEEMWEEFFWWCWNSSPKDAQKLRDKFVSWLFLPLDSVPRWVSLLSEFLGLEEVREKFGWVECPEYVHCTISDGEDGNLVWCKNYDAGECSCEPFGKIRAEWAKG